MHTLQYIFIILEDEFDKSSVIRTENSGVEVQSTAGRPVGYASNTENSSNLEIVGNL